MAQNADTSRRDQLALQRTRLANERTLLAYVRTGIILVATGATIMKLYGEDARYMVAGLCLVALGVGTIVFGVRRFRALAHLLT